MRHRRQGVEGIAALRCQTRIGRRRTVQIEAEVLGERLALEDVLDQFLVTWAEQDGMVLDVRVLALGAEVPDEQPIGELGTLDLAVRPALARMLGQQLAVGGRRIDVGDDHIGRDLLARGQTHAGGLAVSGQDALDLGVVADLGTLPFDQIHQPLDHGAGAAHRRMHAPFTLQEGDEDIDRGHGEGIAADQQRMEGQHLTDEGIFDIARHHPIDGAIALKHRHVGHDAQHVGEVREGYMGQILESDLEHLLAHGHEAVIARHVRRRILGDLRLDLVGIAAVVEDSAVVETDAIEGIHQTQIDVVFEAPATEIPQLFQKEGRGDDGRTGVEREAIAPMDIGPSAGGVELFEYRHPEAARGQTNRRRQTAETTADDDRVGLTSTLSTTRNMRSRDCQVRLPALLSR